MGQELLQPFNPSGIELHFCRALLCIVLALMVSLSWTTLRELRAIRSLLEVFLNSQTENPSEKEGDQ